MEGIEEWWDNLLKRREQKQALKEHIRVALETKTDEYRKSFDECLQGVDLYDKHEEYFNAISGQFDGKAKQALTERLSMNCLELSTLNMKCELARDNIKL